ncbi:LysR substrate-binding domain-containing protein [Homoserinibacter sp. GY 40078]|uniref:LysR substrate-binding domain-containing protein n=1 Tax=Homoserinibacter sp. GY 40078 TaxID=2603275 RepID=UPI0011CAC600|nr:LysR substrate-binding domain-containing protein [Homoserinibacter sp. GY 40078]TXK16351.1 LysR family transcriptional regulator [Homoserinibacter sp. GY 40078]
MSVPFVVAFVPGVTPGKWERIWRDRMPRSSLELTPLPQPEALDAVLGASARMAFLRDIAADDTLHAIPLYRERPVVVAPKDHAVAAFDELALADLTGETILDGQGADTVELVAANVGLAVMPMSVARAHSRRDVIARPVTDAPDTGISLVWRADADDPRIDTFIGIVRGRTTNSSR